MVYAMEAVLRRYGSSLVLRREGEDIPFRGFLQHSRSKSWQNMEHQAGPMGKIPRGQYVLILPMEPEIAEGDTVVQDALAVQVRRIETVMLGDKSMYRWGLCIKKGGEQHG